MNEQPTVVPIQSPPPWAGIQIPPGYEIRGNGVHDLKGKQGATIRISDPVWVSAHTFDESQGVHGLVVTWIDLRGKLKEQAFPRDIFHERGSSVAQALALGGLNIAHGQESALSCYICTFESTNWMCAVNKVGWMNDVDGKLCYVLPDRKPISLTDDIKVIFQPEANSPTTSTMHSKGSLAEWQKRIAEPCQGNPILLFSLCAGFAASLLKHARVESGGFHLYGSSSRGKTTAAQVAASVFGCGADPADSPDLSYLQRWNTTRNGLEALLASHNDSILVLDEIATCSERDIGKLAYDVSGGMGRATLNKNRGFRKQRTWQTLIFSTGEMSIQERIEEGGNKSYAGQLSRIIDIPIDGGIVIDTHGDTAELFVSNLKRFCGTYYGTAGEEFISRLVKNYDDSYHLKKELASMMEDASSQLSAGNMKPENRRSLNRICLVYVAGVLASKFGVLPISADEVLQACKVVSKSWLANANTQSDAIRGAIAVQNFLITHQSRFHNTKDIYITNNSNKGIAGYFKENEGLYLLTMDGFQEACGTNRYKDVAIILGKEGFLHINERGRYMTKHTVNGLPGRLRFYAIHENILSHEFTNND